MRNRMRRVIIESPFAGDVARNVRYARACMLDALDRGEAPIASHLLYPWVLDDGLAGARRHGIEAGLAWRDVAEAAAFYLDRGWSAGMIQARALYDAEGKAYEIRTLGEGALAILYSRIEKVPPCL